MQGVRLSLGPSSAVGAEIRLRSLVILLSSLGPDQLLVDVRGGLHWLVLIIATTDSNNNGG